MRTRDWRFALILTATTKLILLISTSAFGAVDSALKPVPDSASDISSVYRDMIVVQRKAKEKSGRFVLGTQGSVEFGDGPISVFGLGFLAGYALSDDWEVSVGVVPVYLLRDRNIKSQVEQLRLSGGQRAQLIAAEPKLQLTGEVLWSPAYGKDSWGPSRIVRSDTFFRLSWGTVQYQSDSGMRYSVGVGKTFFLSRLFNFRTSANFVLQDTIVNSQKSQSEAGVFEFGSVWYL